MKFIKCVLASVAALALSERPFVSWYGPEVYSFPDEQNDIPFGRPAGYQPLHMLSDGPRLIALGAWLPYQELDLLVNSTGSIDYERITEPILRAWVSENGGNVWMWHPVPITAVRLHAAMGMISVPTTGERLLCLAGGKVCLKKNPSVPCRWRATKTVQCSANFGLTWRAMAPLDVAIIGGTLVQGPAGIFIVGGWLSYATGIGGGGEDPVDNSTNGSGGLGASPSARPPVAPVASASAQAAGTRRLGGIGGQAGKLGANNSGTISDSFIAPESACPLDTANGTGTAHATWGDVSGALWSGVVRANWHESGIVSCWTALVSGTPMAARLYPAVTWSDKHEAMFLTGGFPHGLTDPEGRMGALTPAQDAAVRQVWRIDGADFGNLSAWTPVGSVPVVRRFSFGHQPEGFLFEAMVIPGVGWVPYDPDLDDKAVGTALGSLLDMLTPVDDGNPKQKPDTAYRARAMGERSPKARVTGTSAGGTGPLSRAGGGWRRLETIDSNGTNITGTNSSSNDNGTALNATSNVTDGPASGATLPVPGDGSPDGPLTVLAWLTGGAVYCAQGHGKVPTPEYPEPVTFVTIFPTLFPFDLKDKSQVYARAMAVYLADRPRSTAAQQLEGMEQTFGIAGVGLNWQGVTVRPTYESSIVVGHPFVPCVDTCPKPEDMDGGLFYSFGCHQNPYDAVCFPCETESGSRGTCELGVTMIETECGLERDRSGQLLGLQCKPCTQCPNGMAMAEPCQGYNDTVCVPYSPQFRPDAKQTGPLVIIPTSRPAGIVLVLVASMNCAGLLAFLVSKALSSKTSRRYVSGLCAHRLLCPSGIQLPPAPSKATRDAILYATSCCIAVGCAGFALALAAAAGRAKRESGTDILSAALWIAPISTWVLNTAFVCMRHRRTHGQAGTTTVTGHGQQPSAVQAAWARLRACQCSIRSPTDTRGSLYRAWVLWLECLSPRTALIGVLARQRAHMLAARASALAASRGGKDGGSADGSGVASAGVTDASRTESGPATGPTGPMPSTQEFGLPSKASKGLTSHAADEASVGPMSSRAAVSILSSDIPCLVSALALVLLTRPVFGYHIDLSAPDVRATVRTSQIAVLAAVQFFVSIIFTLHVIGLSRGRISLLKAGLHGTGHMDVHGTEATAGHFRSGEGRVSSNPLMTVSRGDGIQGNSLQSPNLATSRAMRAALAAGMATSALGTSNQHTSDRAGQVDGTVIRDHASFDRISDSSVTASAVQAAGAGGHSHGVLQPGTKGPDADAQPQALRLGLGRGSQDSIPPSATYGWPPAMRTGVALGGHGAASIQSRASAFGPRVAPNGSTGAAGPTQHGPVLWPPLKIGSHAAPSISNGSMSASRHGGRPAPPGLREGGDTPVPDAQSLDSVSDYDNAEASPKEEAASVAEDQLAARAVVYRDLELERDMGITCPPISPTQSVTTALTAAGME